MKTKKSEQPMKVVCKCTDPENFTRLMCPKCSDKTEQPQHTQELKYNEKTTSIGYGEFGNKFNVIGKVKDKANAKRIVKAVNILSEIEKELEWLNKTGAVSEYEKNIKRHYLKLIKQAEQK